jgi:hypothetical protein
MFDGGFEQRASGGGNVQTGECGAVDDVRGGDSFRFDGDGCCDDFVGSVFRA